MRWNEHEAEKENDKVERMARLADTRLPKEDLLVGATLDR